jgi:hypothetical protein
MQMPSVIVVLQPGRHACRLFRFLAGSWGTPSVAGFPALSPFLGDSDDTLECLLPSDNLYKWHMLDLFSVDYAGLSNDSLYSSIVQLASAQPNESNRHD